jgi:hypothetical protein
MILPVTTTDSVSVSTNLHVVAAGVDSYNTLLGEATEAINAASKGPVTIEIDNIPFSVSDSATLGVIQQEIENQIAPQTQAYKASINALIVYLQSVVQTF